jgi:hypothetical protein
MTKVKFLADFRGRLTQERFFEAGVAAEFDNETADALVNEKRAEYVKPAAKKTTTKKSS